MNDKLQQKVQKILMHWHPLQDQSDRIEGLNNYEIEAIDILSELAIENGITAKRVNSIVNQILNEAFGLSLTNQDSLRASEEIYKVIQNTK